MKITLSVYFGCISLNLFAATNYIYKNDGVITYWNPPSGGMMITETNSTKKVDFLYGRNYIKSLIQLGWSTTKPDASVVSATNNVETKISTSPTNVFVPLTTQQWIKVLSKRGNLCLVSIQNNSPINIILKGDVPETLYKDPPTGIEKKKAIRDAEANRLDRWFSDLEMRDSQTADGAGGSAEFVNGVMNARFRLNAEIVNYKQQRRVFEKNCELLSAEIEKYNGTSPTDHPKQVKAYFTGEKEDNLPVWKVVK